MALGRSQGPVLVLCAATLACTFLCSVQSFNVTLRAPSQGDWIAGDEVTAEFEVRRLHGEQVSNALIRLDGTYQPFCNIDLTDMTESVVVQCTLRLEAPQVHWLRVFVFSGQGTSFKQHSIVFTQIPAGLRQPQPWWSGRLPTSHAGAGNWLDGFRSKPSDRLEPPAMLPAVQNVAAAASNPVSRAPEECRVQHSNASAPLLCTSAFHTRSRSKLLGPQWTSAWRRVSVAQWIQQGAAPRCATASTLAATFATESSAQHVYDTIQSLKAQDASLGVVVFVYGAAEPWWEKEQWMTVPCIRFVVLPGHMRLWFLKHFLTPETLQSWSWLPTSEARPPLHVVFFDDDVDVSRLQLPGFIATMHRLGIHLAQPAHDASSETSHALLFADTHGTSSPGSFSTFVECGPVVVAELETFNCMMEVVNEFGVSGYGYDFIWSALCAPHTTALLHDFTIRHLNSQGLSAKPNAMGQMAADGIAALAGASLAGLLPDLEWVAPMMEAIRKSARKTIQRILQYCPETRQDSDEDQCTASVVAAHQAGTALSASKARSHWNQHQRPILFPNKTTSFPWGELVMGPSVEAAG